MSGQDVLILAGSLARQSVSRLAGEILDEALSRRGIATRLVTVESLNLPFFDPDVHYDDPSVAAGFLDAVRRASVLVWCAPSYHRTISGSFKNAIDFMELLARDDPPYLTGKGVAAIATSKGVVAAANTTAELSITAQALHAWVFPLLIPITGSHRIVDGDGNLKDQRIVKKLDELAAKIEEFLHGALAGRETRMARQAT